MNDNGRWWMHGGGRGRSRTYRERQAPSNGFEVRASHRARYSSASGLTEELPAAQHHAGVSLAPRRAHLVEILENLDRQIAPDTGTVLEGGGGEGALGRALGELPTDLGEARQCLWQKKAVIGDFRDAPRPLGPMEETPDRLRLECERRSNLAYSGRAEVFDIEQRADALPEPLIGPGQPRLMFWQTPH